MKLITNVVDGYFNNIDHTDKIVENVSKGPTILILKGSNKFKKDITFTKNKIITIFHQNIQDYPKIFPINLIYARFNLIWHPVS